MQLFHFSRQWENVLDKPHVSIKTGTWCSAGCDCEFSYKKLKKEILYSRESILRNIDLVSKKFSTDFEIFFVWLNLLKYPDLFSLLDSVLDAWRIFKLQIPHTLDEDDWQMLANISERYGPISYSIPKTIDTPKDLSDIMTQLLSLEKILPVWKVYFDIFLDVEKYGKIIESIIHKLWTISSNNKYQCVIWGRFDLKFHDLSWKINHEKKEISHLKRTHCLLQSYFHLGEDTKIFLDDHIEILPSGDLTFHDNLCYTANFSISNLLLEDEKIYKHFLQYSDYLQKIGNGDLRKQCYTCIKNSYKFSKDLSVYSY